MRRLLLAVGCAFACSAIPAHAEDPAPGTPAWAAREAANYADASERLRDRAAQGITDAAADPQRALGVWSPARGEALETSYLNRYGARIAVTIFRPKGTSATPLPSVVIVPGASIGERANYYWLAEDLAEHGYFSLVFDPQGQGKSEATGRPDTCVAGGPWQQPQEMGMTEKGSCAGQPPSTATNSLEPGGLSLTTHALYGTPVDNTSTAHSYDVFGPNFVLGALDATAWMLSDANPWRAWVDPARIGLSGHSAGAYGAAEAANGDPLHRFRAAVSLDGYNPVDKGARPSVPTLFMQSEQETYPRVAPPEDEASARSLYPDWATYDAMRRDGIPTGMIALHATTHFDFEDATLPASRYGSRYASAFALDWFDRFLRDDPAGTRRLVADRFAADTDASSIGTGGLDASGHNDPPKIAGRPTTDAFSFYYKSALALFGADCPDLRLQACAVPAPQLSARVLHRMAGRRVVVGLTLQRGDLSTVAVRAKGGRVKHVALTWSREVSVVVRVRPRTRRLVLRVSGAGLRQAFRLPLARTR